MMRVRMAITLAALLIIAGHLAPSAMAEELLPAEGAVCESCGQEDTAGVAAEELAALSPDSSLNGDAVNGLPEECDPVADLELICSYEEDGQPGTFWENGIDDYNAGLLTVNYRLDNTGPSNLVNVRVTNASATNEVKIATDLPLQLGIIEAGSFTTFQLKWLLPGPDVAGFRTDIEICADCPTEEEIVDEPEAPVEPAPRQPRQEPAVAAATLPATGFSIADAAMTAFATGGSLLLWHVRRKRVEAE